MASLLLDLIKSVFLAPSGRGASRSPKVQLTQEDALRQAVAANVDNADALFLLCDLLWRDRRLNDLTDVLHAAGAGEAVRSTVQVYRALLAAQNGEAESLLPSLQALLRSHGDCAAIHVSLAEVYIDRANFPAAEHHLRAVLIAQPLHPVAQYSLARLRREQNNLPAAIRHLSQAFPHYAESVEFLNDYANALGTIGRVSEAVNLYRLALERKPDLVGTCNNLATALRSQGRPREALPYLEKALNEAPDSAITLANLAGVHIDLGELEFGERFARAATEYKADYADAWFVLGNALLGMSRAAEAEVAFERAHQLVPENPFVLNNLGHALWLQGKMGGAIKAFETVLEMSPEQAGSASNLGAAFQECGRLEEAYSAYRRALAINPALTIAHSNLAFSMHYRQGDDPEAMFAIHSDWERLHAEVATDVSAPFSSRPAGQRLRVGYVSADLRTHSVGYFIEALLENHDPTRFEVYCYSNSMVEDEVSRRLQQQVKRWRVIYGVDDKACREMIRNDGIDILVDLSGHSDGSRLSLFSPRSAPVQLSFLGYPNTTGLSTIDARLVDAYTDIPGVSDRFHTERLVRLEKGFLCYRPLPDAPPVSPLPALSNGRITFVCFNAFAKLSPAILRVWARILKQLPDARLLIKSLAVADADARKHVDDLFHSAGINLAQVEFQGRVASTVAHLEHYHRGDIALDPYPYSGTTTTFEALYMGLPVVTLAGRTHVSRVSGSILQTLGRNEWIADNEDDYVRIVLDLAADTSRLSEVRAGLRSALMASELTDGARYARKVEAAYADLYAQAQQPPVPADARPPASPPRKLHLGGLQAKPGWSIVNIQPGPTVDHLGDITDLSFIPDASIEEVYASHVLEHLGYLDRLPRALDEVFRVLAFNGRFNISVPDLDVLARFILDAGLSYGERFQVMRMMFGGQVDPHDYHHVGLNFAILETYLKDAGFSEVYRVDEFGLFNDTSSLRVHGRLISLNVVAVK